MTNNYNKLSYISIPADNNELYNDDYKRNINGLKRSLISMEKSIENKNEIIYRNNVEIKMLEGRVKALEDVVRTLLASKENKEKRTNKQFIIQY
jgi:hypothetical protein